MNNIVERLRSHDATAIYNSSDEAANLIEQQAERIKELEADKQALANLLLRSDSQLVTLRQRIADAPVVAYVMICKEAEDSPQLDWDTEGWSGSWSKVPLISKEDLQK